MLNDTEKLLLERNLQYQSILKQNPDKLLFNQSIPKFPILFLTCIDPRIDIHQIFQFNPGDIFILRNAGNIYTIDMMRSILIAIHKYKVKHIIVLGHLDCGMTKINIKEFRQNLSNEFLKRLSINYSDLISKLYNFFKPFDNEIRNTIQQINALQEIKTYFPDVEVTGMIYDIKSGWIFTKEDFRDLLIEENHTKIYSGLLYEKTQRLSKFIETSNLSKQETELVVNAIKNSDLDVLNENDFLEKEDINIEDTNDDDFQNAVEDDEDGFELKIPKVQVPKISIPKLKIYIPSSFRKKED
ncbi:MAG: carbonic anhydrase [Candidatus Hodarchaeota archaeon]